MSAARGSVGARAGVGDSRQIQPNRGALARFAVDGDMAVGLLDQPVDHAESQTAALAGFLGGEERLESAFQRLGRHAHAGVADRQYDIRPGPHLGLRRGVILFDQDVGGFQRKSAALGHGVAGVDHQVEQGVLELGRIDQRLLQIVGQRRLDPDVGAQGAPHQLQHPQHQLVQVGRLRQQGLAARERQQPLGQLRAPVHGAQGLLRQFVQLRLRRQLLVQQFQIAHDDGQQVVEIMSDAAGELTDGLHFLRLAELRLGVLAPGDVVSDHDGGGFGGEPPQVGRTEQIPLGMERRDGGWLGEPDVQRRGARFEPAPARGGREFVFGDLDLPGLQGPADDAKKKFRPVRGMNLAQEFPRMEVLPIAARSRPAARISR